MKWAILVYDPASTCVVDGEPVSEGFIAKESEDSDSWETCPYVEDALTFNTEADAEAYLEADVADEGYAFRFVQVESP